ncbi:MAG: mercuric transport protein MerTP [Bacteroidia bacterium]|nr:mercuric transport protein MerTP [Bacteroidia bacterium]
METKNRAFLGTGIIAAFASSLCCIAPIFAIIGGVTGAASMFSWVEPLRPYLIVLAIGSLGFAFYNAYKPKKEDDCCVDESCEEVKTSFLNSKSFLWTITMISALLFTFPYYSSAIFSSSSTEEITETNIVVNTETVNLTVTGMTCGGCEMHITEELEKLDGVIAKKVSYKEKSTFVEYDPLKLNKDEIINAINNTGYTASLLIN